MRLQELLQDYQLVSIQILYEDVGLDPLDSRRRKHKFTCKKKMYIHKHLCHEVVFIATKPIDWCSIE